MDKNLRKPSVTVNGDNIPVQNLDEVLTDDMTGSLENKSVDPNYGILNDYYEIFGEMEEYLL